MSVPYAISTAAAAILSSKAFYFVCIHCPFRITCPAKIELDIAEVEDKDSIFGEFVDPAFAEHA